MGKTELHTGLVFEGWGEGEELAETSVASEVTDPNTVPTLEQTGCPGRDVCSDMSSVIGNTSMTFLLPQNCAECIGVDVTIQEGANNAA